MPLHHPKKEKEKENQKKKILNHKKLIKIKKKC